MTTMTRAHFRLIAGTLAAEKANLKQTAQYARETGDNVLMMGVATSMTTVDRLAHEFARELAGTNPMFKRDTFLVACGVN